METYNKIWKSFFAVALIALAIQQIICADFRPLFIPLWPAWLPGRLVCMYIFSLVLIIAGIAIILEKSARAVAAAIGALFLLLLIVFHLPYQIKNNLIF